jgi:hypothetical protein
MQDGDDAFYEMVAEEIQARNMVRSLELRALADAHGDMNKAMALYVQYRVAQLKEESASSSKRQSDTQHRSRGSQGATQGGAGFRRSRTYEAQDPIQAESEDDRIGRWFLRILVVLGLAFVGYVVISIARGTMPW